MLSLLPMSLNLNNLIWEQLLKIVEVLFSSFINLNFFHVRKVANQVAHYLAKFATSSCSDFV
jgi:hypothetical protein